MNNLSIVKTTVKTTNYSKASFTSLLCSKTRNYSNEKDIDNCFSILSDKLKEYRFQILDTSDGYQIIKNGYGHFKEIRTTGVLSTPKTFKAEYIINKLFELTEG